MRRPQLIINIAFGASLCILLGFGLLCYERFNSFLHYSDTVDRSYHVLGQLDHLVGVLKNGETEERGYLLTHDTSYLNGFKYGALNARPTLDSLCKLVGESPDRQQSVQVMNDSLEALFDNWKGDINRIASLNPAGQVSLMKTRQKQMDNVRLQIKNVENEETTFLQAQANGKTVYKRATPSYFLVLILVAGFITVLSFLQISRELKVRAKVQQMLEVKLQELNTYSLELEQITFAASHDFQEPLRKISTFSNRLLMKYASELDQDARMMVERIDHSAARMRSLLGDLVNFSNLVRNSELIQKVNLNGLVTDVLTELDGKIKERNATLHSADLPIIRGYKSQLHLLFKMLLDNAVKFGREGVPSVVRIDYVLVGGDEIASGDTAYRDRKYHRISVEDNGIGFSDEFAEKMFKIFQTLNNQSEGYTGTGLGLAICQRVVVNHQGYIRASGVPGKSATFYCYLATTL